MYVRTYMRGEHVDDVSLHTHTHIQTCISTGNFLACIIYVGLTSARPNKRMHVQLEFYRAHTPHAPCICIHQHADQSACTVLNLLTISTRPVVHMCGKHMTCGGQGSWVWLWWPTKRRCWWCLWTIWSIVFFADSNGSAGFRVVQMPTKCRYPKVAIFVQTTTDIQTNYFTPCTCAG